MRLSYLAYTFSLITKYLGIVMLVPLVIAIFYKEYSAIFPFFVSFLILFLFSVLLKTKKTVREIKSINDIKKTEGLFVVFFSWVLAGVFSAVPFLFFHLSPLEALFEATSGITTTGATIFTHFDYPKTLFFWRSFIQWLGGMGIIVLFIAILPQFAIAGRQLFFAEAPGPTEEKFTPRIKNTASSLWKIYFGLTVLEIILLKANGFTFFDALCDSMSTVSGGGFSPCETSFVGVPNVVLWIICFFMFCAGVNYNLQYQAFSKFNPSILFKNEEFRIYMLIVLILSLLLTFSLFVNSNYDIVNSISSSFFQVVSVISSAGFCSVDFSSWDYPSKAILFIAMCAGSCASSAGGGIKIMRWLLIFKIMKVEMAKILHSKAVFNIKIDKYSISNEILHQTLMFVSFYILILVISALIIAILEQNTAVGISSAVSAIGNIGPGLGRVIGPLDNYANLSDLSKVILIIDMYVGRLELIPFLVLFQKGFWNFK